MRMHKCENSENICKHYNIFAISWFKSKLIAGFLNTNISRIFLNEESKYISNLLKNYEVVVKCAVFHVFFFSNL